MRRLVGKNGIVRGGVFEYREGQHLDMVGVQGDVSAISTMPDLCSQRGEEYLGVLNPFTGSEIEAAVQAAAVEAFNQGRKLNEDDMSKMLTATVPLSRTMDEQIKAIKSWAHDRAMPASKA